MSKQSESIEDVASLIPELLNEIQKSLFDKALSFRDSHITKVDNFEEFKSVLESKGGFVSAHWDGTNETEQKIKELTKATIRCVPLNNPMEEGKCVLTGASSKQRVLFAKAY